MFLYLESYRDRIHDLKVQFLNVISHFYLYLFFKTNLQRFFLFILLLVISKLTHIQEFFISLLHVVIFKNRQELFMYHLYLFFLYLKVLIYLFLEVVFIYLDHYKLNFILILLFINYFQMKLKVPDF